MELAASASVSVCSAYHHLSTPAEANDDSTRSQPQLQRRRKQAAGSGIGGLRSRCHAVLKQQRTRLYILRRDSEGYEFCRKIPLNPLIHGNGFLG
ncbi:unnamed protein product [Triticum turgidum subsp. durum]|uniref:Uncharacterized protein n=1 Tax=Triticum turgidum subsp. durum TaxID=4567 RepID=A0A9R0Q3P0_TRITD|nr:unnamed protein product [Triticum turgidum subsp. durum]